MVWNGKKDSELEELYLQYFYKYGFLPDGYEEFFPQDIPYEEWKKAIIKSLEENIELPDIYPELCADT